MKRGCQSFLASIVSVSEPANQKLEDVDVVRDFSRVFPDDVSDGIEVDPSKVEEVRDWPVPKSVTEICSFLGLAGYYRKFIQSLSSIVMLMTALTKKNTKFIWGSEYHESFDRLKQALTTAPVLAMPSGQREYVVYTDASKLDALSRKHAVIAHFSVRRPLQAEIQMFELAVYAKGDLPNLATLTVKPTLGDRIQVSSVLDDVGERAEIGPDIVSQTVEFVVKIRDRMKTAQSRQKSYVDQRCRDLEFAVGDHMFVKVALLKGVMRFGKKDKLIPRYIEPFEILERVGTLEDRVALPPNLAGVHNVFHVSRLRKYMSNHSHVLNHEPLQLTPNLSFKERPTQILDRQERRLRNKMIHMVIVKWLNHSEEEAT
ncbi:uncharacterized protein [Primulina huaijiensis]|uniref:uncharacterized protein n=1 Tax=Primulina huaijiensis TaxID=1492673 RepID=UPI003CC6FCEC